MRLNVWMDRSFLRGSLGVAALLAFAGCARKEATAPEPQRAEPPGAEAPAESAPAESETADDESFTTLDEAERALAAAQNQLTALFAPPEPTTAAAPPPPPAPAGGAAQEPSKLEAEQKPASRCELACKAFASLGRAADAVCRLAGDQDVRCARARSAVEDNRRRVASCSCG